MLSSLSIKNFRLFRDLKIEPLNRVNLIAGENNSGKTSVLEALYLIFGDIQGLNRLPSVFRSHRGDPDDFQSFWLWLVYRKDFHNAVELEAVSDDGSSYAVKLHGESTNGAVERLTWDYLKDGQAVASGSVFNGGATRKPELVWPRLSVFSTRLSDPKEDADQFNRIAVKKVGRQRLVELLQVVEPRLQDLQYLKLGEQPLVYADMGLEELIPITQLGHGSARLFRFYSEMLVARSNIVLIDEIENGLHYSALTEMWKGIAAIARQEDLQVFATTHSWECILAAHEVFQESCEYDLTVHRLQQVKGEVEAVTYNQGMIDVALKTGLEIR